MLIVGMEANCIVQPKTRDITVDSSLRVLTRSFAVLVVPMYVDVVLAIIGALRGLMEGKVKEKKDDNAKVGRPRCVRFRDACEDKSTTDGLGRS